ncbi:phosphoribosylamine--glycine ligase [Anaerotruncus sp. AF02-27]|uniref:phosphoribosylamine--glycine ligase n=1 Tax=Anaerotruncus sp. AF02-27 TaxID=2292191 RepID=UPI000E4D1184|nr:phosphoribosylamine--glycine ligase [Anaerotruncus sp. AF02-27]RGX55756.1 phosphoribosylamine--glycine ligase [Anaerotruncus sp. AF02-27]
MKILVVGGGGREHAIVRKLKENPKATEIFCAPGNGGISADAVCVPIKATDVDGMVSFAKENQIDFVVVAPDDPLVLGMVDAMNAAGIDTFGPTRAAARIEGSKVFSKDLMKKYGIPTAGYETFDDPAKVIDYIKAQSTFPAVIKADGLALGKGVIIAQNLQEAEDAVHSIMQDKIFGASGSRVVVEEFLTGPEVSVLAFCDGETVVPMVSSMDHKRALDGDQGLNTGGMGTVAPNLCYTAEMAEVCMKEIFRPTMDAMKAEGCPFSGCLFFGLMLTPDGPKVIEYNCRFGDPETQVVLPLLETDLLEIMLAIRDRRLHEIEVRFAGRHAACVVMASGGYPVKYQTGCLIEGLDENGQRPDATVYHAGTKRDAEGYKTAGGRVLGVTCTGDTAKEALEKAYAAVEKIHFQDAHYRRDIGAKNTL